MSIKFRENYNYRYLDFACPKEAISAVFDLEMAAINADIATRSIQSGPLLTKFPYHSGTISHRIMMVDAKHADKFVEDLIAICAPYDVPETEFGDYAKDSVET